MGPGDEELEFAGGCSLLRSEVRRGAASVTYQTCFPDLLMSEKPQESV